MGTVISFPEKGERKWLEVASSFHEYFIWLGATEDQAKILLGRLKPRWEMLGSPLSIKSDRKISGPLTANQIQEIDEYTRDVCAIFENHLKKEHSRILVEFALLEYKLLVHSGQ